MGRYQSVIYTFGFLFPILKEEHKEECKEEKKLMDEDEDNLVLLEEMKSALTPYKNFTADLVVDNGNFDCDAKPSNILIYDKNFTITSSCKGYPDRLNIGKGFETMVSSFTSQLINHPSFVELSAILKAEPEWYHGFSESW